MPKRKLPKRTIHAANRFDLPVHVLVAVLALLSITGFILIKSISQSPTTVVSQNVLGETQESTKFLKPCSAGNLATSTNKVFQGTYPNETFLQLINIDLLKDVSQLKDLTCLQYLDATDRTVKGDIANLKNLTNLEVFSLYSNPDVSGDICALAGATGLRSLKFAFDPKITGDIACLKNLTKLETFAMTHTQIKGDLSVFANMPNLKALYISGTNIYGDICSLSKLTKLEELGIADEYPGNPDIKGDLACLDNLQKLNRVAIYNTGTTNCEQFTKSHSKLAQDPGKTESGKQGGGGCSKESMKTLIDYAQKYEKKIGKEVQTEVRGQPNYNRDKISNDQPNDSPNASSDITQKSNDRNFITKVLNWLKSLFGRPPGLNSNPGRTEDPNKIRPDSGPGGCLSQAECDAYCDKPENQEECSKFGSRDQGR